MSMAFLRFGQGVHKIVRLATTTTTRTHSGQAGRPRASPPQHPPPPSCGIASRGGTKNVKVSERRRGRAIYAFWENAARGSDKLRRHMKSASSSIEPGVDPSITARRGRRNQPSSATGDTPEWDARGEPPTRPGRTGPREQGPLSSDSDAASPPTAHRRNAARPVPSPNGKGGWWASTRAVQFPSWSNLPRGALEGRPTPGGSVTKDRGYRQFRHPRAGFDSI
jgi:hypothetical protein